VVAHVHAGSAYSAPSRGITPRSILEGRTFADGADPPPMSLEMPFKDFYDQLLCDRNQPQVSRQTLHRPRLFPEFCHPCHIILLTPSAVHLYAVFDEQCPIAIAIFYVHQIAMNPLAHSGFDGF
jgi:hypothetical protein